jgi:GDPmannose 4,6-dehydratase
VILAIQAAGLKGNPLSYIETDTNLFRPLEIEESWGDASKARIHLGWEPKVSFEQLIQMMVLYDIELAQDKK